MSKRLLALGVLLGMWMAVAAFGRAQVAFTPGAPMHLTAWAVNMSNLATGANAVIDIKIKKWSTMEERKQLITTLLEKGPDELLDLLWDTPVKGRFRIPGYMGPDIHNWRLGIDLRYAMQFPQEDGGMRIMIATDRYIGFQEQRANPRTMDYPFTFIEIHLNKDGKGEGKMAVATKLEFDKKKNVIEMENYSSEPVRLQQVKVEEFD